MSYGGITADILFHEPLLFEKYMEDTLNDIKIPLDQRLQTKGEMSETALEIAEILNGKEQQIKVLADYLYLIIEKTQEKIFEQSDKIETLEHNLSESQRIVEELEVFKDCFNDTKEKKGLLEQYLTEIEQKHEETQRRLAQAQFELKAFQESENRLTVIVAEQELNKVSLQTLKEEKQNADNLILSLKDENMKLKEEIGIKMEGRINQLNREYEELNTLYKKQTKSYDMDKENFENERKALKDELDFITFRSIEIELELEKTKAFLAKATQMQKESREQEEEEDLKKNLNFKFGSITSHIMMEREYNSRINSDGSQESTANSLENFVPDNYDGIRGNSNNELDEKENQDPQSSQSLPQQPNPASNEAYRKHMARLESKRRDIFEEFFLLTTQSVLLNSPYFNALAGIDNSGWYSEVSSQNVPYYKWYKWIENKFEDIHNTNVKPVVAVVAKPEVKAVKKAKKNWFKKLI